MADGYLEKHHADYEARKAAWLSSRPRFQAWQSPHSGQRFPVKPRQIERPEDEAL